jgi:ferredoxin
MLHRHVPGLKGFPVYLCGPEAMMTGTRATLLELGVPEDQIKMETFTPAVEPASAMVESPVESAILPEGGSAGQLRPWEPGTVPIVQFLRSGEMAELPAGLTILEAAEDVGLDIPFECRSGICGQCKTKLLAGHVTMEVEDALSARDKSNGIILACQAHSSRDVAVDA